MSLYFLSEAHTWISLYMLVKRFCIFFWVKPNFKHFSFSTSINQCWNNVWVFYVVLLGFVCLYKNIRSYDTYDVKNTGCGCHFFFLEHCPNFVLCTNTVWWFFTFKKVNLISEVITPCHMGFIFPDLTVVMLSRKGN